MPFSSFLRFRNPARPACTWLVAAALIAMPGARFAAADDAVPDMQIAQVWEPGDPLPGGSEMPVPVYSMPEETGEPLTVPDAAPDGEIMSLPARSAPMPMPPARREAGTTAAVSSPAPASESAPAPAPAAAIKVESEASDPQDFLCTRAPIGKTAALPAPFDRWLVRVCAPQGQALVPVLDEAWVAHGSADPVSILAMPPGGLPPTVTGPFDERYDIRFTAFQGGKSEGTKLETALQLLKAATGAQDKLPAHDEVWQLDALSNVNDARYNIFFYLEGKQAENGRPKHLIVCLDQCRQALYLDVLRGEEAKEVLGE